MTSINSGSTHASRFSTTGLAPRFSPLADLYRLLAICRLLCVCFVSVTAVTVESVL